MSGCCFVEGQKLFKSEVFRNIYYYFLFTRIVSLIYYNFSTPVLIDSLVSNSEKLM